METAHQPVLEP